MVKRAGEIVDDGYARGEINVQFLPGADRRRTLKGLHRLKSVKELHQIIEESDDTGSLYLLRVNPRYIERVISRLRTDSVVGEVSRVGSRETQGVDSY